MLGVGLFCGYSNRIMAVLVTTVKNKLEDSYNLM